MDIHLINRRLKELYGQDFLRQPIFRVVWSDDELEKRFGEFEDYLEGTNIFLRRFVGVREAKKYNFMKPQYILEKLFINKHNREILDNDTFSPRMCTYEPFWCFGRDDKDRPIKPVWRAVELVIVMNLNPKKLTPSQMNDEEFRRALEDEKIMTELLNTHVKSDALHSSVQDGDTVMFGRSTSEMEKAVIGHGKTD